MGQTVVRLGWIGVRIWMGEGGFSKNLGETHNLHLEDFSGLVDAKVLSYASLSFLPLSCSSPPPHPLPLPFPSTFFVYNVYCKVKTSATKTF